MILRSRAGSGDLQTEGFSQRESETRSVLD
jgi:hypothetical protein